MTKKEQKLSTDLLNRLLANTSVLFIQTLHYHWNIEGPEFHDYHVLLDDHYNDLLKDMDVIAERVRAVQGQALGSMKDMIKYADLKEDTGKLPKPKQMIAKLLKQYETQIEDMREAIIILEAETTDFGSQNMLEDLIEKYEKTAWMLRSIISK